MGAWLWWTPKDAPPPADPWRAAVSEIPFILSRLPAWTGAGVEWPEARLERGCAVLAARMGLPPERVKEGVRQAAGEILDNTAGYSSPAWRGRTPATPEETRTARREDGEIRSAARLVLDYLEKAPRDGWTLMNRGLTAGFIGQRMPDPANPDGYLLTPRGREEREAEYRYQLAWKGAVLGRGHPVTVLAGFHLVERLVEEHRLKDARTLAREVLSAPEFTGPLPDPLRSAAARKRDDFWRMLAFIERDDGNPDEERKIHRDRLARAESGPGARGPETGRILMDLALCLETAGRKQEAAAHAQEAMGLLRASPADADVSAMKAAQALVKRTEG